MNYKGSVLKSKSLGFDYSSCAAMQYLVADPQKRLRLWKVQSNVFKTLLSIIARFLRSSGHEPLFKNRIAECLVRLRFHCQR